MRWKAEEKPVLGDRREVKSFALFPTTMSNGDLIWLESYTKTQEYCRQWVGFPFGYDYTWFTIKKT